MARLCRPTRLEDLQHRAVNWLMNKIVVSRQIAVTTFARSGTCDIHKPAGVRDVSDRTDVVAADIRQRYVARGRPLSSIQADRLGSTVGPGHDSPFNL